jgi:hypothetical protein
VRRLLLVLPLVLLVAGCGDDDDDDVAEETTTTVAEQGTTTTSSTTTTAEPTTTSTAFDGSTTPTSMASTASSVALLTDVTASAQDFTDTVTFTFRDETPGFDVAFVEPPILADGSGEPVEVDGEAFLQIRMEPASGVDLSGEEFEETYTGPERFSPGLPAVAEVVRTGDFEANLTWVIGLNGHDAPYRIEVDGSTVSVVFLVAG